MNRHQAEVLGRALTGGLHVDSVADTGCSIEAAIAHVAACQLRAIRMAMVMGEPADTEQDEGRGWCISDKFTQLDAVAAIGGVMSLLQESHYLAEEVRRALALPDVEAAERDLETMKQAAAQRGAQ